MPKTRVVFLQINWGSGDWGRVVDRMRRISYKDPLIPDYINLLTRMTQEEVRVAIDMATELPPQS